MTHVSLTPFGGQPVTAAMIASQQLAAQPPALPRIDKWALFAELRTARTRFGLSDRSLTVLNALLSFLPARDLEDGAPLVVFPSNAALSDRAHGMSESTLRRHLAALVQAGLIWRRDSPNGKRFCRRAPKGERAEIFGFDLRPLLLRAESIAAFSAEIQAEQQTLHRQRETLVLRLRDATKFVAYGRDAGFPGDWDAMEDQLAEIRRVLRRRMQAQILSDALDILSHLLRHIRAKISFYSEEMIATDSQNERHLQNSKIDSSDSELCKEAAKQTDVAYEAPALPLALVAKACPDAVAYCQDDMRTWYDLVSTSERLRGMMGVSPSAWHNAQNEMGPENAAVTLCAMLQRFDQIANPGGYLRALTAKAARGAFSPGPMIMALLRS